LCVQPTDGDTCAPSQALWCRGWGRDAEEALLPHAIPSFPKRNSNAFLTPLRVAQGQWAHGAEQGGGGSQQNLHGSFGRSLYSFRGSCRIPVDHFWLSLYSNYHKICAKLCPLTTACLQRKHQTSKVGSSIKDQKSSDVQAIPKSSAMFYTFFLAALEFELRAMCLQGRHSTT
jgi:hypothetical protein